MFKSLFDFRSTHPTSLTFAKDDLFVEVAASGCNGSRDALLSRGSGDEDWLMVLDSQGDRGFVPRNYVVRFDLEPEQFQVHLDRVQEALLARTVLPERERVDGLAKIEILRVRHKPKPDSTQRASGDMADLPGDGELPLLRHDGVGGPRSDGPVVPVVEDVVRRDLDDCPDSVVDRGGSNSSCERTPPKASGVASKKRTAPRPPQPQGGLEGQGLPGQRLLQKKPETKPDETGRRRSSVKQEPNLKPGEVRNEARNFVEMVRETTGLSHQASQDTVKAVLEQLMVCQTSIGGCPLERLVPALAAVLSGPVDVAPEEIASSADSRQLEAIFQQLVAAKSDDQQRNWALHEDEAVIVGMVRRLNDLLQSSDPRVSVHVLGRRKYEYVREAAEYFQMEVRRSIRMLLLETFFVACSLDPASVVPLLLNSVLPLELAQDLYAHADGPDAERTRRTALVLTAVFSRGDPMPVQYADHGHLGADFVDFALERIGGDVGCSSGRFERSGDHDDDLSDAFVGLVLSYNLQFRQVGDNLFIQRLARLGPGSGVAKTFTEKILLLLNREDDPAAVISGSSSSASTTTTRGLKREQSSVQKVIEDMFGHRECSNMFYTNDLYVLIDIIIRQLADLCHDDPDRVNYVRMCRLVLAHGDYSDHLHRFRDLQERFIRILDGEENAEEKRLVSLICREVAAFNYLVQP